MNDVTMNAPVPDAALDRLFRKAIFAMVPYPGRMRLALIPAVVYQWIQPALVRSGLLDVLPQRLGALARLAPPVSFRSLTARTPGRTAAIGDRRMTVGVLTGCVQRLAFHHVNEATVRVLAAEGCAVPRHPRSIRLPREFARRSRRLPDSTTTAGQSMAS